MDKYIGKRLDGRYEIRELIGVGGMAYVYKAYDTIDDQIVAVKILKEEYLANEEFTRRFKNESKAIAILSHPNIVKVYDVSFGERLQYIVMEYIDGITLKEYIDQQKDIRWKEAVHFTVQILRALQHAHDKGIVHRDIKPQNIMLLPDGTIKVTDFGIARFSRTDARLTSASDKAIGSVHYISPEQARGEITDEKADIYSVGVMLYEMLTGQLPFEADNAVSIAIMQLQAEPKHPREINPQIPEGLEDITIKAMQKDPARRYQSAAEMLYDIDEFKRNPSIHFEYKYFVDETPTRFVEAITRVKGEPVEEPADVEDEEEERKGPPVLPILAAIAGAFVLIALLFGVIVLVLWLRKPQDEPRPNITVDNFVGQMYEDVANNVEYIKNYTIDWQEKWDKAPAGMIIDQNPPQGRSIKIKDTVTLYVSKGEKKVDIPSVQPGQDQKSVLALLELNGFTNTQIIEETSSEVAEGFVIRIEPGYPNKVPVDTMIRVYVSTGEREPDPKAVPNVEATAQAEAIRILTENGFVVNVENIQRQNHDTYAANTVISQSPAKDTMLKPGSEVTLVVSSGFKDIKNLVVKLPTETSTLVDLQVIINGKLRTEEEYSTELRGLMPNQLKKVTLTLREQLAIYNVTIKIKRSGDNDTQYQDYISYTVDGQKGEATIDWQKPFVEGGETTSTTEPTESSDLED